MNARSNDPRPLSVGAALSTAWMGSAAADKLDDIKTRGKLLIGHQRTPRRRSPRARTARS